MGRIKDIVQTLYPIAIFRKGEAVYLTFDDGPIPEVTPQVLAILERYGVKATFFMVGDNVRKYPEVYEQVKAGGHTIANHTFHHMKGMRHRMKTYLADVDQCARYIDNEGMLFRPPYGKAWLWQRIALRKKGYRLIYWDVLTRDYEHDRSAEAMLEQIKRETRAGSIINFHDSIKSNERMLAVLPQAIEWLQEQGYVLRPLR